MSRRGGGGREERDATRVQERTCESVYVSVTAASATGGAAGASSSSSSKVLSTRREASEWTGEKSLSLSFLQAGESETESKVRVCVTGVSVDVC